MVSHTTTGEANDICDGFAAALADVSTWAGQQVEASRFAPLPPLRHVPRDETPPPQKQSM